MPHYYRNYDRDIDLPNCLNAHPKVVKKMSYDDKVARRIMLVVKSANLGRVDDEFAAEEIRHVMMQHIWTRMGRPTWQIHPDMMDMLESFEVKAKTGDIFMPHDVMSFVFPYGTLIAGIPCRSCLLFRPLSEASIKEIDNFNEKWLGIEGQAGKCCNEEARWEVRFDFGGQTVIQNPQASFHDQWYSKDLPRDFDAVLMLPPNMLFNDLYFESPEYSEEVCGAFTFMASMALKALLYVQAVKEEGIDQAQRPKWKNKKAQKPHRELPPWTSVVRPTKKLSLTIKNAKSVSGSDRKGPKPHLRGWVLRTLRHERFSRNEDGSLKIILIEPTLIGTNSLDEVDERPAEELRPRPTE